MKSVFNIAYLNLLFGGIGILTLIWFSIRSESVSLNQKADQSSLYSIEAKFAGGTLLVASLSLLLDTFTNIVCGNRSESLFCRTIYAISTFLFGLQLSLQQDIFQIFPNYEICFCVVYWSYRIVLISTVGFYVNVTDTSKEKYSISSVLLTILICIIAFKNVSTLETMSQETLTLMKLYKIFGIAILFQQNFYILKYKASFLHILYVNLALIIPIILVIVHNQFANICTYQNCQKVQENFPLIQIYVWALLAIFLAIVPGSIANKNVFEYKDQLLRLAEQEINKLKDEIVATETRYERFFSHELKNPLNVIGMGIEYGLDCIPKNTTCKQMLKLRDALIESKIEVDNSLHILNVILENDKIKDKHASLKKRNFNVLDFILKRLSFYKMQIRSKNINLKLNNCRRHSAKGLFELNSGKRVQEDDTIELDESKIDLVLRILMSSAIKFTPENGTLNLNVQFVPDETINKNTTIPLDPHLENEKKDTLFWKKSATSNIYSCGTNEFIEKGMLVIEIHEGSMCIDSKTRAHLLQDDIKFNLSKLQAGGDKMLGLSITKSIVDMHQGKLYVYSDTQDKGSFFRVEIPMARVTGPSSIPSDDSVNLNLDKLFSPSLIYSVQMNDDMTLDSLNIVSSSTRLQDDLDISGETTKSTNDTESISSETISEIETVIVSSKRMLIVDDVLPIRNMMRRTFEKRGHKIDQACHGQEAICKVIEMMNSEFEEYDVILMDSVMPIMNGIDATKTIRKLGYKGLIIGVTANGNDCDKVEFKNAGLNHIIIKPLDITKLSEFIEI